jgi:protein-disulfide isomerase
MSSNRQPGRSSKQPVPPTTRRSARQERLANRRSKRDLYRASTRGTSGGNSILIWTGAAVAIAVVVIGAALLLTQNGSGTPTGTPIAPGIVTPSNIPQNGQTLGAANAPVTLDVYSDFRCSGCFSFYSGAEPKLIANFVAKGTVKLVYHDVLQIDRIATQQGFPTNASRDAANAAMCAADEGKFWTYHDWLFSNSDPNEQPEAFSIDRLIEIAKAAGIDNAAFESCVRNGQHNADVVAQDGARPSGVNATPTIFVNGTLVSSSLGSNYQPSYDEIVAAINAALAGASPSASASASTTATPSPSPAAQSPAASAS